MKKKLLALVLAAAMTLFNHFRYRIVTVNFFTQSLPYSIRSQFTVTL